VIQGAGGQLVQWWQQNQGGSDSWGSGGWGTVTEVVVVRQPQLGVVVAVGVMTVEVVAAEAAMVGAVMRLLRWWAVVLAVWCTSRMAYMQVREVEMMAVIWPPLSCQVEMRRKKQKKLI